MLEDVEMSVQLWTSIIFLILPFHLPFPISQRSMVCTKILVVWNLYNQTRER